MDAERNQVPVIAESPADLALFRNPTEVLLDAKKAATSLTEIIRNKKKPVLIHGEQYLEFEDWQTLGQFYGYTVKTGEASPVEINGISGAKAIATLIDRMGRIMGGAEAYCMSDEENWHSKPWFQLASMAQTRAGAKALRNRLAWVAVLAGFKPTPAEEMDSAIPKVESPFNPHEVRFRKIKNQYETSKCASCGNPIPKGSEVWYNSGLKGVRCMSCGTDK